MAMKIDFHVHTEFSNDSNLKVEAVLNKAKKENFYIAITDHNKIGGYLKSQGLKEKNRAIPGIETTSLEGVHILFYFTKKENLVDFYNEVIKKNKTRDLYRLKISALDLIKKGKKYKAFVGFPHPFSKNVGILNSKIKNAEEYLRLVYSYEINNGSLPKFMNQMSADFYEQNLKKRPITVGSDAHFLKGVGNVLLEVNNFKSLDNLFKNLKNKNTIIGTSKFKISTTIKKELILFKKSNKKDYFKCRLSRLFK